MRLKATHKISPLEELVGGDLLPSNSQRLTGMFLVFKEKDGKIKVHRSGCAFISKKQKKSKCDYPLRRSAESVDSLIGQVRAIFHDFGRGQIGMQFIE